MKKFIFTISILSASYLLGQTGLKTPQKMQVKAPDAIEILVNELLSERRVYVPYRQIQKDNYKSEQYFVQMSAYIKREPASLIRKIEQRGYNTTTQTVWRNDKQVNLLLVGPYNSKAEVRHHLSDLKSLVKDAFIYKAQ